MTTSLGLWIRSSALGALAIACGGTSSSARDAPNDGGAPDSADSVQNGPTVRFEGHGPTYGGCPADEPARGSSCAIAGRLCTWDRVCGANDASAFETTDTGWCSSDGVWAIVPGVCEPGCPKTQPPPPLLTGGGGASGSADASAGPSLDAHCPVGLTCHYPSTPLGGGVACTCKAASGGITQWPATCDAWDDGWSPAPSLNGSGTCTELAQCGGESGCSFSCPSQAPKSCYCGPDGRFYCQIGAPC